MTRRRRVRERYLHQIIESREYVPHALARAFRAGCDCTAVGVGVVIYADGTPDPVGRWTIEHEPRCPYVLAALAVDDIGRQGPGPDDGPRI